MCGRYTLKTPPRQLALPFGLAGAPDLEPRYNIAPTTEVLAVRETDGRRVGELMRWQLVPPWAKDPNKVGATWNAIGEEVADKPTFRVPWKRSQRCLIPADSLFEWTADGRKKLPWLIRTKDAEPFAFAGLWDSRREPDGSELLSCTILTTGPSDWWRVFHHRQAVMLPPESYDAWLDPETPAAQAQRMLAPYPPDELERYRVSTKVNATRIKINGEWRRNDGPDLIEPIDPEREAV
jgi:putative SOS response-associated peptidase YedK